MGIMQHDFIGAMDLDSPIHKIPPGFNMGARNGIWRGVPGRMRLESVVGTTVRTNSLLPAGFNKCINSSYDPVNQQIFDFNWNSFGNHGIYIYSTQTDTWQTLIQTGINTVGDPLEFNPYVRIHSVDIIYGDENSGNLLFFVDSLGRPTKLNIQRYLSGTYTAIDRSFLEVIKAPPRMPPRCTYENDTTVTVNNLLNSLFKFRVRWVYDDNDKSVYSTGSIVPLPVTNSITNSANSDPTKNCRISLYVPTGDIIVKKIEIWVQQSTDKVTGNWLLVTSLDKGSLSINDNDIYRFLFYNDAQYTAGDEREILSLQDYVPLSANAQCLLNGNTLMYGGLTEGQNHIEPEISFTSRVITRPPLRIINGVLFFAAQSGVDSYGSGNITFYLTGAGNNDAFGNPIDLPILGDSELFTVDCAQSNGTSLKFSYTNVVNNNITTILNGLKAAAIVKGFTVVSTTTNSVTISFPGAVLYYATVLNTNIVLPNLSYFAYNTKGAYQLTLCYFDKYGRTIGAEAPLSGGITIPEDVTGVNLPEIITTISHRPPQYAYYWSLLRAANLTYSTRVTWICNQTFTNVDLSTNTRYAYIGISNMITYNQDINTQGSPTDSPVVSYDFKQGDRIRFLIRYPFGSAASNLPGDDYEITSVEIDPVLNGVPQIGKFIKILYPSQDITANFDFGGVDFQNYKILLYNYVKHPNDIKNTVFYEFGKMFAIGNPGTTLAYHIASEQTQSSDLSVPAIVNTSDGDLFFRQRIVPAGGIYYINGAQTSFSGQYATINTNNDQGIIDNPSYQIAQQTALNAGITAATYPTNGDPNQLYWNKTGLPRQIRLRGSYTVAGDKALEHNLIVKVALPSAVIQLTWLVKNFQISQANNVANAALTVTYDQYISVPAGAKAWILAENQSSSGVSNIFLGASNIRLDDIDNIQIPIIESSFSDKYNIVTNSNLRPLIYDPNAGQFYYNTKVRWGQAYQLGTSLNNSNRFYGQDLDEFDKSFGDIRRLIVRGREVDVFQHRKCGHFGVYGKFLRNNQGEVQLIATNEIITPNNVQYYIGDFGVGNQPDAISISWFQRFFADPVKGFICRLSLNGIEPISEIYKVQTWAGANLPNYLQTYNNVSGGYAVILGVFNFTKDRDGEALFILQAGTTDAVSYPGPSSTTITQPPIVGGSGPSTVVGQSLAFNDRKNAFSSFYDYAPDAIVCAENKLYSFHGGVMYSHDNETDYCNFYGTQYVPSITIPFNDIPSERKTFTSISQTSNVPWNAPLIYTDSQTYGTQRQESKLVDANFALIEGNYYTSFYRDIMSQKGWLNGDFLKGNLIIVQLQVTDGSSFSYLSNCNVNFIDSPLNKR